MPIPPISETIILYILIGVMIILIGLLIRLEMKLARILRGKNAQSLEDTILHHGTELDAFRTFEREMHEYLKGVEARLRKSTQGVHTVRFNPFKGVGAGGNQSFATAFLNEHGDGVVLSSLYTRDRVSMFAKPIRQFSSEYELTKEEREAVDGARENKS